MMRRLLPLAIAFGLLAGCAQAPPAAGDVAVDASTEDWFLDDGWTPRDTGELDAGDWAVVDTGHPDAGDPPKASCDAATPPDTMADGPACALPRSECADADWLVYYEGGDCVDGGCVYRQRFHLCSAGCGSGRCLKAGTAH